MHRETISCSQIFEVPSLAEALARVDEIRWDKADSQEVTWIGQYHRRLEVVSKTVPPHRVPMLSIRFLWALSRSKPMLDVAP